MKICKIQNDEKNKYLLVRKSKRKNTATIRLYSGKSEIFQVPIDQIIIIREETAEEAKSREQERGRIKGGEAYKRNPEKMRMKSSIYHHKNREKCVLRTRTYYRKNKDKAAQYYQSNKDHYAKSRLNRKLKVFQAYCGGEIKCKNCGNADLRVLSLDHINGGGGKHAKETKNNIYGDLIKRNFPEGFQVLCMNCNWAKRFPIYKIHPLRFRVLNYYSSGDIKCCRCQANDLRFLCLDHMNSDGAEHRKKVGNGRGVYRDLEKRNFPEGFQVLCQNCNFIKKHDMKEVVKKQSS
jgi:hypothetical protein